MVSDLENSIIVDPKSESDFRFNSYLIVCEQWLKTKFISNSTSKIRDEYMAENLVQYLNSHSTEKVFLSAHNDHIANLKNPVKTMGAFLKEKLLNNYLPLCITSAEGSYLAAEDYTQTVWKSYPFENAYQGTYEYILEKAKANNYFLPFTKSRKTKWLTMNMQQLDHGYISGDGGDYKFLGNSMTTMFDGLFFLKKTMASKSLIIK